MRDWEWGIGQATINHAIPYDQALDIGISKREHSRDLALWSKLSNYTNEILIVELHREPTPRDRVFFVRTRCQFTPKSRWNFRLT
mgnify:FL=1